MKKKFLIVFTSYSPKHQEFFGLYEDFDLLNQKLEELGTLTDWNELVENFWYVNRTDEELLNGEFPVMNVLLVSMNSSVMDK